MNNIMMGHDTEGNLATAMVVEINYAVPIREDTESESEVYLRLTW